jgi:nitroreductase
MDTFEAIGKRHSYRGSFDGRKVPREDLLRIVQAGIQAPSGHNAQSTSFVIVDEPSLIAKMAEITDNDVIRGAPAAIVCVMDPRVSAGKRLSFGVEDYSAAVENMLLAITAMGYASVWIDGVLREGERSVQVGDLLCVPRGREVRVILPVGAPVEHARQKEKKPLAERAWFNRYRDA